MASFVALGDSFTEGLDDPRPDQGGYRGWADRFAELLAAQQPGLRYANLAVRGKLLGQVAEEQVPQAIAMAPDLVSVAAGGNDLLRFRADPDVLAQTFDEVVRTLLMAGSQVLIFTGFDPRFPVLRLIRGRVAAYNMHLRAIADRHGCRVVDLWAMHVLRDPRAWSADRLHLTPDAHRRVALRACEAGGVAGGPADGRAVGAGARRPVAGPPGARHLFGRRHAAQAPRTAPAVTAGQRGARSARMSSRRASAAAIQGRRSGSGALSARSCCSAVSPYSRPVATRSRSTLASSPNALAGSTAMP
jgi:lysophospholipase L1-like esterase